MFARLKVSAALGVALAIGLTVLPADAQVQATVVLKSGERHTGSNLSYRIDSREINLRSSFTEAPRIPIDQVAYVDFGGTRDINVALSGSQHALVLRDGSIRRGQVIELGHGDRADETTPYLVIFRDEGGEELRLPASKVARVYFASSGAVGTSGSTATAAPAQTLQPGETRSIVVPAGEQWKSSGVTLRRGERIAINASGQIRFGGPADDQATPAGSTAGHTDSANPFAGAPTGALIGRIGTGQPFHIGNSRTFQAPSAGELFLGINDAHLGDNSGEYTVEIRRVSR